MVERENFMKKNHFPRVEDLIEDEVLKEGEFVPTMALSLSLSLSLSLCDGCFCVRLLRHSHPSLQFELSPTKNL